MKPKANTQSPPGAAPAGGPRETHEHSSSTAIGPVRDVPVDGLRLHAQAGMVPLMPEAEYTPFLADIRARGVLTPLDVTADGVVLDGRARLQAARQLGLRVVLARVIEEPADSQVAYMLRAALLRRNLSESQRAVLAVELASVEELRAGARERQLAGLRQNQSGSVVATVPPRNGGGKTRDRLADLAGVSPRTIQNALTVHDGDPGLLQQVKEGRLTVSRAANRVRRAQRDTSIRPAGVLPVGPFGLIYADPPWQLGNPDGDLAPERHYPTMPLDQIKELVIPAAEDCVLYLWAVSMLLPQALEVIEAWGFRYVSHLVWVKPSIGPGNHVRHRHELLLKGQRGRVPLPDPEDRPDSVTQAPRGPHSAKPMVFYELLEQAHPDLSKLELFARTNRPGWASWGNQAPTSENQQ